MFQASYKYLLPVYRFILQLTKPQLSSAFSRISFSPKSPLLDLLNFASSSFFLVLLQIPSPLYLAWSSALAFLFIFSSNTQRRAMAVGHVAVCGSTMRARKAAPRRGQVKAAIARSVIQAVASMVRSGARSMSFGRSTSWHYNSS